MNAHGPVVLRPISANPGLNVNPGSFISLFNSFLRIIFSILFRTSNNLDKRIILNFLSKLSDLRSAFTLTLAMGYLNPGVLNNPVLVR